MAFADTYKQLIIDHTRNPFTADPAIMLAKARNPANKDPSYKPGPQIPPASRYPKKELALFCSIYCQFYKEIKAYYGADFPKPTSA